MTARVSALVAHPSIRHMRVTWSGFAASGDVGDAVELGSYQDRSVMIAGTWGTAEITIEGSNDGGTTFATLTDPQGNSLVKTANAIEAITEPVGHIRPRCTAGAGGTVKVSMFFGGHRP